MGQIRSAFLRTVIAADAGVCVIGGAVLAFAATELEGPFGLSAGFLREVGWFLVGYGAVLALLASRPSLPRAGVWALVVFNGLWAIESVAALVLGWLAPTTLGLAAVVVQAMAALAVADLEFLALKRAPAAA